MKKDDWKKLAFPIIFGGIFALGVACMQSYLSLVIFLVSSVGLITFFLICMKYFSEPEKDKVIEMLREFMVPLIGNLKVRIDGINQSLKSKKFSHPIGYWINPNYEYAPVDVLSDKDSNWIKEKIGEYNKCVDAIGNTVDKFKKAIRKKLKERYQEYLIKREKDMGYLILCIADNYKELSATNGGIRGFANEHREELLALREEEELCEYIEEIKQDLNEAKKTATELKTRLDELRGKYMIKSGITKGVIEKN
jgi:hypothetical protein